MDSTEKSMCEANTEMEEKPFTSSLNIRPEPTRVRICNRLWSHGVDSEKSIPPAYVARRAGTKNRVVVLARQAGNRFLGSSNSLQIRAQKPVV
jgi:hypothetical protein